MLSIVIKMVKVITMLKNIGSYDKDRIMIGVGEYIKRMDNYDFNDDMQRDVCWSDDRKNLGLKAFFQNTLEINPIFAHIDKTEKIINLDGKQRSMLIVDFINNKIPFYQSNKTHLWFSKKKKSTDAVLSKEEQIIIKQRGVVIMEYKNVSYKDAREIFWGINNEDPDKLRFTPNRSSDIDVKKKKLVKNGQTLFSKSKFSDKIYVPNEAYMMRIFVNSVLIKDTEQACESGKIDDLIDKFLNNLNVVLNNLEISSIQDFKISDIYLQSGLAKMIRYCSDLQKGKKDFNRVIRVLLNKYHSDENTNKTSTSANWKNLWDIIPNIIKNCIK